MEAIDTGLFVQRNNGYNLHTEFERYPLLSTATVGERIHYFRHKHQMFIDSLADKSGISYDTILRYENGQTEPSPKNLLAIAQVLDISPDKLCDGYYRFLLYPYGQKLKEIRGHRKLTQQAFAQACDLPLATIKRWEQGVHRITRAQWVHLVNRLTLYI